MCTERCSVSVWSVGYTFFLEVQILTGSKILVNSWYLNFQCIADIFLGVWRSIRVDAKMLDKEIKYFK